MGEYLRDQTETSVIQNADKVWVSRDVSGTPTSYYITAANLLASIASTDLIYTTTNSGNAYSVTASEYTAVDGGILRLYVNTPNTGAVSLNVNGDGAIDVKNLDYTGTTALDAGEWSGFVNVVYNSSLMNYIVVGVTNYNQFSDVNLIKNSSDIYNQIGVGTRPQWWSFTGSGSTEFVSATAAGITNSPNDLLFKVTSAAASDAITHTSSNADEPQLKSNSGVFSSGVWVYVSSGTWEWHIDVDSTTEYDSGTIPATTWTFLSTEGLDVGSTDIDFILTESAGAGVMYFTQPMLNKGSRLMPYKPRGLAFKNLFAVGLAVTDPGGSAAGWTSLDLSSATSNITALLDLTFIYGNQTSSGGLSQHVYARPGFSNASFNNAQIVTNAIAVTQLVVNSIQMACDDSQIIEYYSNYSSTDSELLGINVNGYYEWES